MSFAAATAAIGQALSTQRLGTPVAARVLVHTLNDARELPALTAHVAMVTCDWLGSAPRTLFAQGDVRGGQLTVLLRLEGGQSALVSVGTKSQRAPAMEIILFGNRGTLSWEGGEQDVEHDSPAGGAASETEQRLLVAIRQAIQTRDAVSWNSDGTTRNHPSAPPAKTTSTFSLFHRTTRRSLEPPYGLLLVAGDHTHQPGYAEAFLADPRCRLVGITDDAPSLQRQALNHRLAERLQTRVLPNLREALERPDVHIVSICAEPERRAPMIVEAAKAGRHIYLDKPLCASPQEAAQIVAAVREHNVLAHMFTQVSWDPATRARQWVDSGELGELVSIHCDICFAKGYVGTAQLGRPRVETSAPSQFELPDAKRELTNIGVYGMTLLLWLLRRPMRRVFASTGNYFFAEHQTRDMEDFGQVLLELDGGVTASITAGRTGWRSHPSGGLHRIHLIGERGAVVIDAHRPRAEIWSTLDPWIPPPRDPDDPLAMWAPLPGSPFQASPKQDWILPRANQWSTDVTWFLDCLEKGTDSHMTVEVAASATEALFAAYQSAATGCVIGLPLSTPSLAAQP